MQAPFDLAALRQAVMLLDGEVMLEGWAAERAAGSARGLGLLVVTSWRVLFVDLDRRFTAFPIFKIHAVEGDSLCEVTMSAWYDRMQLRFDSPATARAALNLVRQNPAWTASEAALARHPRHAGETARAPLEPVSPSNDIRRAPELAKAS